MPESTVSVIIPTHKRPDILKRALESVNKQTHPSIDVLIVFDDQEDLPGEWRDSAPESVRLLENRGSGVSAARNTGIAHAKGQYIAFLDDDDEWSGTKIERHIEAMAGSSDQVIATYSGVEQRDAHGRLNATKTPSVTALDMLAGNPIGTFSTLVVRSEAIDKVGMLDESLSCWEDWDYYLRLFRHGEVEPVSEPLVTRYSGHGQLSDAYRPKIHAGERLLDKHLDFAETFKNGRQILKTGIEYELGKSATHAREYSAARRHFYRACKTMPQRIELWPRLAIVIGGPYTFKPVQIMKRTIARATRGRDMDKETVEPS